MRRALFIFLLALSPLISAEEYDYQQLMTKDYGEMKKIIYQHIKSSAEHEADKAEFELISEIKKGLILLLMRPDRDGLNSSLISALRDEISKYRSFAGFLNEVVQESLKVLKSKTHSSVKRASHLFIIENALSYAKGLDSDTVLKTIQKAKIEVPESVINERRLNAGVGEQASPSELAKNILKKRIKKRKIAKKAKDKAKARVAAKAKKLKKSLKKQAEAEKLKKSLEKKTEAKKLKKSMDDKAEILKKSMDEKIEKLKESLEEKKPKSKLRNDDNDS